MFADPTSSNSKPCGFLWHLKILSLSERTGAFDYQFDSVTCEGFIAQVRAALALGIFSESVVLLGFCVLFPKQCLEPRLTNPVRLPPQGHFNN